MTRIGRVPHNREFPTTMAAEAESLATTSIVLRAPEGEVGGILVELQGTVEALQRFQEHLPPELGL